MGDYIRGKKAYTKWDADSENVDIEYRPDGQKAQGTEGWLSGIKGRIIKVLLLLLLFSIGLIFGYLIRRGVHEGILLHPFADGPTLRLSDSSTYSFTKENSELLQNEIKAENIKDFLRNYTSDLHIAGKRYNQKYAEYIRDLWLSWGLDKADIEEFSVLLSYPSSDTPNKVQIKNTKDNTVRVWASESGDDELHPDLRPYLAYSPNSTAKGKLVYANYGRREDFEYLLSQNITVKGSIVMIRLGKINMANKVELAEDESAVGVLLYPDPEDYVGQMEIYPKGLGLPSDSIIRGSLSLYVGDPDTPLFPALEKFHRENWHKTLLPGIPVQPISYGNALRFLSDMTGPDAPVDWRGGLNVTYKLGPGHSNQDEYVKMEVFNEMKTSKIYNVVGSIKGKYEPDRYVIVGNHYDSWTNGTGDPGTGLAAFMETVRAFAELTKTGWRPGRSLLFTCWDAKEFGMIGSTEWLKLHHKELATRAVAYINTDASISGGDLLLASGSPLLQAALRAATQEVPFTIHRSAHARETVNTWWKSHTNGTPEELDHGQRLGILGSNSDYSAFQWTFGIPSIHLQFAASVPSNSSVHSYPLYHSAYDNFEAFANFVDPEFNVSQTLSRLVATLALLLTDSMVLPMNCEDYGSYVQEDFRDFNASYGEGGSVWSFEDFHTVLGQLNEAIENFAEMTILGHFDFTLANMKNELLGYHEYNDRIMELERAFLVNHVELGKLTSRHFIYGPNPHNKDEGILFPHLVDAILVAKDNNETKVPDSVKMEAMKIIDALDSASRVLRSEFFVPNKD